MNKIKNTNNGITIITLIITIILIIILASVTITVVINGGLFEYAGGAKDSVEIANEKDIVQEAFIWAKGNSKRGKVTKDNLQKNLSTDADATVIDMGDSLVVKFNNSDRYYQITNTGNVEYLGKLKEKAVTLECVDSTGKVIASKNLNLLWERYSITLPQVEGYEPSVEVLTGEIGNSETIQALYYQIFQDDTTLVFTGLDSSGNVTTDEESIVSYMVGDGNNTNTYGNGLKEKTVLGILKIPENYKGKPVTTIGKRAFARAVNTKQVIIGKNIITMKGECFDSNYSINKITFNNNMNSFGQQFIYCSNWTQIDIGDANSTYKVVDNILYSADGKKLIRCPVGKEGEFIVPDTVEVIEENAFSRM